MKIDVTTKTDTVPALNESAFLNVETCQYVFSIQAPAFFTSPWLSQTMGFSLERAAGLLPAVLSEQPVRQIDDALRQLDR